MQDLIEKNIDGLSVRGFMVGCRLKKKITSAEFLLGCSCWV